MCTLSVLAVRVHDVARAQALAREAEQLARAVGDSWILAQTLGAGGEAFQAGGDFERARAMFVECLQVAEANELGILVALANFRLGRLACLLDDPLADHLLGQAVALARRSDDPPVLILAVVWHARAALASGDLDRATWLADEGIELATEQRFRRGIVLGEEHAGQIALARGDRAAAASHFAEALRVCREIGEREGFVACLEGLAASADPARPDELALAAHVLGAADACRASTGRLRRSVNAGMYARAVDLARQHLGDATFETAFANGRALPIEQAVDVALRAARQTPRPAGKVVRRTAPSPVHLTPRERQVAALVMRGLTNRQIAATLVISERTADGHVASILSKLGFATRSQIAAWAVGQQLSPADAL
jgi:non-specific serine/threonine protein kinase